MVATLLMVPLRPIVLWPVIFLLPGINSGIVGSMERAFAADLLPLSQRGTGIGVLASINSIGDLVSSVVVGLLWGRVLIEAGASCAAFLAAAGGLPLALWRPRANPTRQGFGSELT